MTLTLLIMYSADVHRDFKWPCSVEREIAAPAHQVWSVISRPGNLESCHPFCKRNPVGVWPGSRSRDEVHYLNGLVFERRFRYWNEGLGYDLEIGRKDGGQSWVSWRVTAIDEGRCALRITVYPFVLQGLPIVIRWPVHVLWLHPLLSKYLDSVVRGFDWYIIHRRAVPKNAFGKHPWFSSRAAPPS
jgi:hypothetical protein